jgi:hypothetical protein
MPRGRLPASYYLGTSYLAGLGGLPVSASKAVACFRQAAASLCSSGMCALADALSSGTGVARDTAAAVTLYREAAEGRTPRSVQECNLCGVPWGRGCVVGFCVNSQARAKAKAKLAALEKRAQALLALHMRATLSVENAARRLARRPARAAASEPA